MFKIGETVIALEDGSGEYHEFIGTIKRFNGELIEVIDQEDNCYTIESKYIKEYK